MDLEKRVAELEATVARLSEYAAGIHKAHAALVHKFVELQTKRKLKMDFEERGKYAELLGTDALAAMAPQCAC